MTGPSPDTVLPADAPEWASRSEAAEWVGCSHSSVRNWQDAGDVEAQWDDDGPGQGRWLVRVRDVAERYQRTGHGRTTAQQTATSEIQRQLDVFEGFDRLLEQLTDLRELQERAARADLLADRVQELHTDRERERERLRQEIEELRERRGQLRDEVAKLREELADKREEVAARDAVLWGWQRRRLKKRS